MFVLARLARGKACPPLSHPHTHPLPPSPNQRADVPHNFDPIPPDNFWAAAWHQALAGREKARIKYGPTGGSNFKMENENNKQTKPAVK